jgi:UDPglucose 6-dehydrogenase
MILSVIGHGYVGIVAACVFADFGNTVHVIGHTPEKILRLQQGDPLIYEPGLSELLQKNIKAKRLIFTTDFSEALSQSQIVFICVGTPPKISTGEADLSAVFEVAKKIGENISLKHFSVISCKSTVPVGTNERVKMIISSELEKRKIYTADRQKDIFSVASCPEFLREGTGIHDSLNPDRTVIGAEDSRAIDLLLELHKPLPGERIVTNIPSAELIKYASNSLLATKLSFANMIALFAEKVGADAPSVLRAVGMDNRIGQKNLDVSIGYGGACFPKDVQALTATGRNLGIDISLLESVETINKLSWENFVTKVKKFVPAGSLIAVWGLSFKANTDDIRFSPAIKIVDALVQSGYKIQVYDPVAMDNTKRQFGDKVKYTKDALSACKNADGLCVLTEWNEFRQADMQKVRDALRTPTIIDGRNLYDQEAVKKLGLLYISTGRMVKG